ncbi:membrane protein insertion efficiency factor YidD [Candidatus Lucifugimonas marina]|uniref:Putative membrane protein insertion efficiency factor n=1 Tax=Candidatus Lucifugimonas marina TaxID=3038979 RepID=A0AAJ5ZFL8_9CHLR|nr:membrane protein insertion efficiency factor YidD [SAR202 cluster bacterium JH702]MDG0870055.1 membrane protein insertion efficiency factor YidD [SAR202 cluster bacterium JH639]WFG36381.1 membrane protein insertion efficiency factor YidD [SAR202 cluster bacterium JH545]WFG40314.1 membrane protein insertion efficiency factor YidD [SAR202 cluster bacterium JH1073]
MRHPLLLFIKFYKLAISPYWPGQCRYDPTCSEFAADAIKTHGSVKGAWLAAKRIGRCHPGRSRGYDPVPEKSVSK